MGIQPGHIHKPGKIGRLPDLFSSFALMPQQASFLDPEP